MTASETESGQATTPSDDLRRLVFGYRVSQALYAVAELGVADLLADGPRSVDDLATACSAHAPSLYRVLRFLASEGVFTEPRHRWFALTPMADMLRRDVPGSLRPPILLQVGPTLWQSWGHLVHAVRTGEPAFDHAHGIEMYEYYRRHPDEWAAFDHAMTAETASLTRAVTASYDFSPCKTVVDVGGGRGALAIGLLEAYPHLRGIVFDQPDVAAEARRTIEAAGLAERCAAVGGDFFKAVPEGGDTYLAKYVLHNWDDERCVAILGACRRAMPVDGRLLVIERVIPQGEAPSFAKAGDVNMLAHLPGCERTEAEYRALYEAAGFSLTRAISAQGEFHVIEGIPA
jgi:predicted O-methyltransferase YrrM